MPCTSSTWTPCRPPWAFEVDFDVVSQVIATGPYRLFARRMRGHADEQARHTFRDLVDMPVDAATAFEEVVEERPRRAHLSIVLASDFLDTPAKLSWWKYRPLRFISISAPTRRDVKEILFRETPGCPKHSKLPRDEQDEATRDRIWMEPIDHARDSWDGHR